MLTVADSIRSQSSEFQTSPVVEYHVTTFYKFKYLDNPSAIQIKLENAAAEWNVLGLIIIGVEGFNATISCHTKTGFEAFKEFIRGNFAEPELFFKDSVSDRPPFKRFKVKVRSEIVTLATPELVPNSENNNHLSPAEWNHVLKEEDDFLLLDTRNWYETEIGTFAGAVNPEIDKFSEFPAFVEKHQVPKDKKILIFCTGGIRCEKGILELQEQGFSNVHQLNGGILNYLKEFPNDEFKGECFVFDQRVALKQDLRPSDRYTFCPHCGQPAEVPISCQCCGQGMQVCTDCVQLPWKKDACSKDCAYRYQMKSTKLPRSLISEVHR
jgi:UPF0176 protein